jgi:endonuclease-3
VATKKPHRRPAPKAATRAPGSVAAPKNARAILDRLRLAIPAPRCELDHHDAWSLLVATILSAQSTDRTVNSVTPELFRRWPSPASLAAAERQEVEQAVYRTGFFRNKAKAIQEASAALVAKHDGQVPRTIEQMVDLPGVARKTANVVLGTAYGIASGVVVDTHVMRVARRLGFTKEEKPERIEADLCRILPQDDWVDGGHRLLLHGRYMCLAKAPRCEFCALRELCPSGNGAARGSVQERAAAEWRLVETRGEAAG